MTIGRINNGGRVPVRFTGMGDISADLNQVATDAGDFNFSQMFSDPISGVPLWLWGTGAVIVYMFLFAGGEHSRVSRGRRAVKRGAKAAQSAYS